MRSLKKVRDIITIAWAIFEKEIKIWLRYPAWIFTFIALPYMVSGFFYGIGYAVAGSNALTNFAENTGITNPFLFYTIGTAMLLTSQLIINDTASSIRNEQLRGTFELHYLAPTPTYVIWFLHVIPHATITFMVLLTASLPLFFTELNMIDPLSLVLCGIIFIIGIIPLLGIGLVMSALTVRFKEPWAFSNTLNAAISLLSGFFYPLTVFPEWVRVVSQILPTTHLVQIFREIILLNRDILLTDYRLLILAFLATSYPIIGFSVYRRWEENAKKRGELSKH